MSRRGCNDGNNKTINKGLIITSTPIGNLGDLSPRAMVVLSEADIIACEDTRHTGLLLSRLGITHGTLVAYHDHSSVETRKKLLASMLNGLAVALVSDSGTPLISDPGYRLVKDCYDAGIEVRAVPGASALLAGLVISGLPTDRFYFGGFLPSTISKKRETLMELLAISSTVIFYDTARRLPKTMAELAALAPERLVFIGRELTKLYEEGLRDTAKNLAERLARDGAPKGEVVVVVAGEKRPETSEGDAIKMLSEAMADGLSRRDAVRQVSASCGISRSRLYALSLGQDDKGR